MSLNSDPIAGKALLRLDPPVVALAGRVAHDYNNILAAIHSQMELVSMLPELPEAWKQHAEHIAACTRKGIELAAKLGAIGRVAEAKLAPIHLAAFVSGLQMTLTDRLPPSIPVHFDAASAPDLWVQMDEDLIQRALVFLGLNARDAMREGGRLSLSISQAHPADAALLPAPSAEGYARITLSDSRAGSMLPALAVLFDNSAELDFLAKGLDLGLVAACRLAASNQGWISAEKGPAQGAQFHVFLPCVPAPSARENTPANEPDAARNGEVLGGTERILVVDDEDLVRVLMRAVLSYRGYHITEATDGFEAIEMFRAASPPFDLILLDIELPNNLNGWQTLEKLRQANPEIPVIMLSGRMDAENPGGQIDGQQAYYLCKPFENKFLLQLVRRALTDAKTRQPV